VFIVEERENRDNSMGTLMIRELIMDCRRLFRGWMLFFHGIVFALFIFLCVMKVEVNLTLFFAQFSLWTSIVMKPKMGKLIYLLPTNIEDRRYYVVSKCIGIFLYNLILYLIALIMIRVISGYPITGQLQALFTDLIPIFVITSSMVMGAGYNLGKSRDKELSKRYQSRHSTCILLMVFPLMKIMLLNILEFRYAIFSDMLKIIMVMISYLCTFAFLYVSISIFWHTELSPENEVKVEKLFS
jgi:hypothetical protein